MRRREIKVDECRLYLGRLSAIPLISHEALPLRQVALEIGLQIGSSFYDGLFLALALQLGGRLVRARKSISVTNEVGVELYHQAQYNQCVTLIDLRALTADSKLYRKIESSPFDPWAFWITNSL